MILINVREYRRVNTNGQDVNQTYKQILRVNVIASQNLGKTSQQIEN
jgi:hypothetical protein